MVRRAVAVSVTKHRVTLVEWLVAALIFVVMAPHVGTWIHHQIEGAPSRTIYQHPYFLSRSVASREDAARYEVYAIAPGAVYWRWLEYCLDRPMAGEVTERWVGEHYAHHGRTRPNINQTGCHKVAIPVDIPARKYLPPPGTKVQYLVEVSYPQPDREPLINANPPITAIIE